MPDTKSEWFGRLVGAILIAEGVLFAILRFLVLVYVVASEAYNADSFRTPLPSFLPWVLITAAVSFVLVWAGSFFRREPGGAWAVVGTAARVDLAAACLLNVGGAVRGVFGLTRGPSTIEGWVAWIALCAISLIAIVGLVHDAMVRRPVE